MAFFFSGAVCSSHCSGVFGITHILTSRAMKCRIVYNLAVKSAVQQLARYLIVLALDVFVTWFCFRFLHRNPTTVGFLFLLAILVVSATWGLRQAILMSLLATLLYNFFFLPPLFTFTI